MKYFRLFQGKHVYAGAEAALGTGPREIVFSVTGVFESALQKATKAFRNEIQPQMDMHRSENHQKKWKEVKHVIPLEQLVEEFCKKQNISLKSVQTSWKPILISLGSVATKMKWMLSDPTLQKAWQEYHKENSSLQVLSPQEDATETSQTETVSHEDYPGGWGCTSDLDDVFEDKVRETGEDWVHQGSYQQEEKIFLEAQCK